MGSDVLAEILEWSTTQPAWQRDALRRLFTTGALTEDDIDELLALCKARHGLTEAKAVPLGTPHLAVKDGRTTAVTLTSVTHHRGVNALAIEQTLSFGQKLTVVYGQNAAGKSGYSRILKGACRTRSAERSILGNVLSGETPLKAKATIAYRDGAADETVAWTPDGPPAESLTAVSVFDSNCTPVYLHERTNVAFRPFSLDVFDKLSVACTTLKGLLERERLDLPQVVLPTPPAGTAAATLVDGLSALTKPEAVNKLATLSKADESRLAALRSTKQDLASADPKQRARELELKSGRYETLATTLGDAERLLGGEAMKGLRTLRADADTATRTLEKVRKAALRSDVLPGTGEDAWQALWESAAVYSAVAYPEDDFPVTHADSQCPLCQQPLGKEARDRLKHLADLVTGPAHADAVSATAAYAAAAESIAELELSEEEAESELEELRADDEGLERRVRALLRNAVALQEKIAAAGASPKTHLSEPVAEDLTKHATSLRQRAASLRAKTPQMDPREAKELSELEGRVLLRAHLQAVLDAIERKKQVNAYFGCDGDTATAAISRKSTELTKRLVTDQLGSAFHAELVALEFIHLAVEIRPAGATRGALFHQLVFSNAPGAPVAKVLSEGESRALSLAAFLAELSTAPTRSGIIFDDPVSSLDHMWRERIARRLVQEAKARQVVVFTHDIMFLKVLKTECESDGVACNFQYVRRDDTVPGICSGDLPWDAMSFSARIGTLRSRWQAADKTYRNAGADAYEREARDIYGALRESWEQGVAEVLLQDIVEPYRPEIMTQKVRYLDDIETADCAAVKAGMDECSRWMRGHKKAAGDGTPFPKPAQLQQRVQDLDDWAAKIRKRRKDR